MGRRALVNFASLRDATRNATLTGLISVDMTRTIAPLRPAGFAWRWKTYGGKLAGEMVLSRIDEITLGRG